MNPFLLQNVFHCSFEPMKEFISWKSFVRLFAEERDNCSFYFCCVFKDSVELNLEVNFHSSFYKLTVN